jgi:hypothetical protein
LGGLRSAPDNSSRVFGAVMLVKPSKGVSVTRH